MTTKTDPTTYGNVTIDGNATVHYGNDFGTMCGAGFNRRGGRPTVRRTEAAVTCKRACGKHVARREAALES